MSAGEERRAVIAAIAERDAGKAEQAARAHIRDVLLRAPAVAGARDPEDAILPKRRTRDFHGRKVGRGTGAAFPPLDAS
jgi:hypothetical protein